MAWITEEGKKSWERRQAEEERKRREANRIFRKLCEQIAACLSGWELAEHEHSLYLRNEDQVLISLDKESNGDLWTTDKGRVVANVSTYHPWSRDQYYKWLPYNFDRPKCTAAARRGASAIARDIERKVIPGAVKCIEDCHTAMEEAENKQARKWRRLDDIAAALGGRVQNSYHGDGDNPDQAQVLRGEHGQLWRVEGKVSYGENGIIEGENFSLNPLEGYLVYARQSVIVNLKIQSGDLTSCNYDLHKGINLIGIPVVLAEEYFAYDFLRELGKESVVSIRRYNGKTGENESVYWIGDNPIGIDFSIRMGEGYFVIIQVSIVLVLHRSNSLYPVPFYTFLPYLKRFGLL